MIIDFHTHPWLPRHLNRPTESFIREISPAVAEHGERLSDPSYAADVLRDQGVDRAVVLPEHCPETSGNVRTETVLEHCAAEPEFYIPFASVNPNLDVDPAGMVRRYLADGAKGLKLYPSYQFFYPDETRHFAIYEACAEAGVPLLLHVGSSVIPGTRLEYCHPRHLEPVARAFPALSVVMAHGGRGHWYDECARLTAERENVHIDLTGLVPRTILEHFPTLPSIADRVVFGSDWPAMPKTVAQNVAVIRDLGLESSVVDRILAANAARLLRLPDPSPTTPGHGAEPASGADPDENP